MFFNFVNQKIAVGEYIGKPERLQSLVDAGITHIINCQIEVDDWPLIEKYHPELKYLHVGVSDDHKPKPVEWFAQIIGFSLGALLGTTNKVYVHCAIGKSRSPSAAYAVLRALGYGTIGACEAVLDARPGAVLNYRPDADEALINLGFIKRDKCR